MRLSPIEKQFYEAFFYGSMPSDVMITRNAGDIAASGRMPGRFVSLDLQVRVLSYVVDFLVTTGTGRRLAVECDGHDFHERTKAQAAHDRRRDRELLMLGIPTLRFTGSEIYRDAARCAADAWSAVLALLDADEAARQQLLRGFDFGRYTDLPIEVIR